MFDGRITRSVRIHDPIFTKTNAASKALRETAEGTISESGLDWTILRPTMIYGTAADRNMARLLRFIARSPVVPLPGGGDRLQQPVHVDDLAGAVVAAFLSPRSVGVAYNIAGPDPLSLRRVVEQASIAVGRRPLMIPVPMPLALVAVGLYQRLAPRPRLTTEQIWRLAEDKAFDISTAEAELNYSPLVCDGSKLGGPLVEYLEISSVRLSAT